GWLYAPFAEDRGGLGGSVIDTLILFEELGRQLVVEPFLESLVLTGGVLSRCESDSATERLSSMMEGELQGALAHTEPGVRSLQLPPASVAERHGHGYRLRGKKTVVFNAEAADVIIVTVTLADSNDLGLFLLESGDPGLAMQSYSTIDGRTAADLSFSALEVPAGNLLASGDSARKLLETVRAEALLACCADMLGSMNALLSGTIAYTRERQQFGSPLVDFQVLRHRMVDMYVATELTTSLLYAAAMKLRDQAPDALSIAAAAKVKADRSAKFVAHSAIQLHGGIATTDEFAVGHHLKRITVHEQRFGSTESQLQDFQRYGDRTAELPIPRKKVA
ncbi:MAG: acyl-CoA dehydrogenase, partial [Pseudomonadota bacterium]